MWSLYGLVPTLPSILPSPPSSGKKSPHLGPFSTAQTPALPLSLRSRKPAFRWLGVVRGELGVPLGGLFVVQILLIPGSAGSLREGPGMEGGILGALAAGKESFLE